jgi:alanyl-tRNA synthetase
MSQPKRYALRLPDISYGTEESPNGEYVRYADYAALKAETVRRIEKTIPPVEAYIVDLEAENERLKGQVAALQVENERHQNVIDKLFDQRSSLRTENERLRKAGDEMEKWIKGFNQPHISAFEWLAAKGVQS